MITALSGREHGSNPVRVAKHDFPMKAASIKDLRHPEPVAFRYPNRGQKGAQIGHFEMTFATNAKNVG